MNLALQAIVAALSDGTLGILQSVEVDLWEETAEEAEAQTPAPHSEADGGGSSLAAMAVEMNTPLSAWGDVRCMYLSTRLRENLAPWGILSRDTQSRSHVLHLYRLKHHRHCTKKGQVKYSYVRPDIETCPLQQRIECHDAAGAACD